MLRHIVLLLSATCLTMVLCTPGGTKGGGLGPFGGFGGFGGGSSGGGSSGPPGLIIQQRQPVGAASCRPRQSHQTHIRTVVQEQPVLKTVQQKVVQFVTETLERFATVTTGSVAFITTTVLVTDFNTRTRTVTQRNTETHTRYAYIPTLETAIATAVQNQAITTTEVAYETVFTPQYVTQTQVVVSTQLQDEVVYDVRFETAYNFVAAPVSTTVTEQIPDPSTQTIQVQGLDTPIVAVTVDKILHHTQPIYNTVPLYVTSRVQAVEYHTVTNNIPVTATVTATVDCFGGLVNRGPADAAARTGDVAVDVAAGVPLARSGDVTAADTGSATPVAAVADNATEGAVARTGAAAASDTSVSIGEEEPQVLAGVLLNSNSDTNAAVNSI